MTKESASKLFDRLKWVIALAIFGAAVVGNSYFSDIAFLYRVLGVVFLFIIGLVFLALTSFGSNSIKLMRENLEQRLEELFGLLELRLLKHLQ